MQIVGYHGGVWLVDASCHMGRPVMYGLLMDNLL